MADLPFETPEFSALLDAAADWMAEVTAAIIEAGGEGRVEIYAAQANMLIVAGARLVAGYIAQERSARAARHNAYTRGAVEAPKRETRAQRIRREATAWGLAS